MAALFGTPSASGDSSEDIILRDTKVRGTIDNVSKQSKVVNIDRQC